jgi:hypothetical protein
MRARFSVLLGLAALGGIASCKKDGEPPPVIALEAGLDDAAGADAALDGTADSADAPPLLGDCLTGAAAELVRAIVGKQWALTGYIDTRGQFTSVEDICTKNPQLTKYYAYFAFYRPGEPVVGTPTDPACQVVIDHGFQGIFGVRDHSNLCAIDSSTGNCIRYLWQLGNRNTLADGTMVFEAYPAKTDGTPAKGYTHSGAGFRLDQGKLLEAYIQGDFAWRVYEASSGAECPSGITDYHDVE